ncbi:condensation domain-containing protein, partial [Tenacibaculum agarivorans]|uniref:condensation domain-containing protein n=1 Tax=Tenacibaculum agarivorans TaxID=1908389 RepID=UPI000AD8F7D5
FSTTHSIELTQTTLPIGKPIKNSVAYIVDSSMNLVPVGVVGELVVGGSGVGLGYLNNEELTKEKFTLNPFKEGDRLYKTGDLAKWLPDGTIEFIGRKDSQVKIRGYRIELGEIENALSNLVSISQCCVLAKESDNGTKRLIGYVVSEDVFDKEAIQTELKEHLPDYMIPSIWVELEEMPLTNNGKLDRKALPTPTISDISSKEYVAPRNKVEEVLASIWQEILGVEQVGVYDDFFELGGHSLLVVQLISRLQKLDYHVSVKDIFSTPTIAKIGAKVSSETSVYQVPANGITADIDRITPEMVPLLDFSQEDIDKVVSQIEGGVSNIEDMYPLSPLQEGMHFHYLMSDKEHGDPYILPNLLSFPNQENRSLFVQALQTVVNRHDILRTCIVNEGLPSAVQVVLREVTLFVEALEIDNDKDVLLELEVLTAPGNQWMDISKAPLLTFQSADDVEKEAYYLIVYQHHLILDHVGLEKVVEEVELCLLGNESALPEPVLYRDFIGHTLHQQAINDSETYFKELLEDIDEPTYPFGLSDIQGTGSDIKESEVILSEKFSKTLRDVSVRLGMSPAVLFHAAYGLVIGRCSNTDYAIFGSLFSGRLQGSLGAADSLGLFINTLPFFVEIKGSVVAYVTEVKNRLKELLPYEQTPLASIQNLSGISNEVSLFSTLLNYRHSHVATEEETEVDETASLGITIIGSHERTNYPFTLNIDDYGDVFGLTAQIAGSVNSDRVLSFMEETLEQLVEGLELE